MTRSPKSLILLLSLALVTTPVPAQAYQKLIIPHDTRPTLGTAASLQFLASSPNAGPMMEFVDLDRLGPLLGLFPEHLEFRGGYLSVPTRPGMGLDPRRGGSSRGAIASAESWSAGEA